MDKKILTLMLVFFLSFFILSNCAGSRDDSGEQVLTDDEKQQKELDDIEALLGISTADEPAAQKQQAPAAKNEEQLNLLDTRDRIDNSQNDAPVSSEEKKKLESKISRLEEQLRQKDKTIANLNAELTVKDDQRQNRSSNFGSGTPMAAISDVSMGEYEQRYDAARSDFENRNYQSALELFESMLSASSSHSLSDNAQFWIGECHYALGQYDAAIIDFEKVFTFANSNKADDAQYKLGLCYARKGDKVKAREELDRLVRNFPKSEYLNRAQALLAKL